MNHTSAVVTWKIKWRNISKHRTKAQTDGKYKRKGQRTEGHTEDSIVSNTGVPKGGRIKMG